MADKPRIALLLSGFGVIDRGSEQLYSQLIYRLRDRYTFTVFCRAPRAQGREPISVLRRDHPITNILYRIPGIRQGMNRLHLNPQQCEWFTAARSARSRLRQKHYDLFIPSAGLWGARLAKALRREKGTPWIFIQSCSTFPWMRAVVQQEPDAFISPLSSYEPTLRGWSQKLNWFKISNGVDLGHFHPGVEPQSVNLERPVYLCAAALEPVKRIELTLKAVAHLEKGSLLLLGEGSQRDKLVKLGERLLGPRRFSHRVAKPEEMAGYYTAADVFTLASSSEGLANVYLEALAANRPVVTQDDAQRRETLGAAALVCDCEAIPDYAEALKRAAQQAWGNAPREQACAFSWEALAERYAEVFDRVIKQRVP